MTSWYIKRAIKHSCANFFAQYFFFGGSSDPSSLENHNGIKSLGWPKDYYVGNRKSKRGTRKSEVRAMGNKLKSCWTEQRSNDEDEFVS